MVGTAVDLKTLEARARTDIACEMEQFVHWTGRARASVEPDTYDDLAEGRLIQHQYDSRR